MTPLNHYGSMRLFPDGILEGRCYAYRSLRIVSRVVDFLLTIFSTAVNRA